MSGDLDRICFEGIGSLTNISPSDKVFHMHDIRDINVKDKSYYGALVAL